MRVDAKDAGDEKTVEFLSLFGGSPHALAAREGMFKYLKTRGERLTESQEILMDQLRGEFTVVKADSGE